MTTETFERLPMSQGLYKSIQALRYPQQHYMEYLLAELIEGNSIASSVMKEYQLTREDIHRVLADNPPVSMISVQHKGKKSEIQWMIEKCLEEQPEVNSATVLLFMIKNPRVRNWLKTHFGLEDDHFHAIQLKLYRYDNPS